MPNEPTAPAPAQEEKKEIPAFLERRGTLAKDLKRVRSLIDEILAIFGEGP